MIRLDKVVKRYRTRVGEHTVLNGVDLEVNPGDKIGILGRNGAGKSTTIRMALGLVRPTSGRVRLLGFDMARQPRRALASIGAIIDTPAFYENFSGWQNLRMFAAMSGGAKRNQVESVLETVGLRDRAHDPVRVYSHGMRQRLGIAQALLPVSRLTLYASSRHWSSSRQPGRRTLRGVHPGGVKRSPPWYALRTLSR